RRQDRALRAEACRRRNDPDRAEPVMNHLWRPLLALLVLGGIGGLAVSALELDYRLDAFLPAPRTTQQEIVVEQVSGGSAGRLILAAIAGDEPTALAATSSAVVKAWRELAGMERVDNGDWSDNRAIVDRLMRA